MICIYTYIHIYTYAYNKKEKSDRRGNQVKYQNKKCLYAYIFGPS